MIYLLSALALMIKTTFAASDPSDSGAHPLAAFDRLLAGRLAECYGAVQRTRTYLNKTMFIQQEDAKHIPAEFYLHEAYVIEDPRLADLRIGADDRRERFYVLLCHPAYKQYFVMTNPHIIAIARSIAKKLPVEVTDWSTSTGNGHTGAEWQEMFHNRYMSNNAGVKPKTAAHVGIHDRTVKRLVGTATINGASVEISLWNGLQDCRYMLSGVEQYYVSYLQPGTVKEIQTEKIISSNFSQIAVDKAQAEVNDIKAQMKKLKLALEKSKQRLEETTTKHEIVKENNKNNGDRR